MQIKYIVATIASLAVSSAIAGPVAEPAGNVRAFDIKHHRHSELTPPRK